MNLRVPLKILILGGLLQFASACRATTGAPPPEPQFFIDKVAERTVEVLPEGPLYWRVETFASLAEAMAAAGGNALAADLSGRSWLFTLAPAGGATPGGTFVAEIGPVPVVAAPSYLLRVNRAGGPPGAETEVHTHPGSEAFLVLSGQLSQRTAHGTTQLEAGETLPGHEPGMVMQLSSSGEQDLEQLVMFVVDAGQPFSSPAEFK